jgi:hypothetical protein
LSGRIIAPLKTLRIPERFGYAYSAKYGVFDRRQLVSSIKIGLPLFVYQLQDGLKTATPRGGTLISIE